MKEEKKKYYNTEILNCLIDGEVVSTQQIANTIGMSEKSVRNKIFDINEYLKEKDMGIIKKKPRVGMWLECTEEQRQRLESVLMNRNTVTVVDDDNNRIIEVLKIFFKLRPWETITTQRLTEELYLSAPTVLKVIRECEKWLEPYNVKITNEKNRGYRLDCHENEYRVAMKDLIMGNFDNEMIKKNIDYFFYNIDTKLIHKSIIETENEWNYRFTDESFYEIYIYCCIAYQRREIAHPNIHDNGEITILQKYNEYPFTVAIFEKIQQKFHVIFSNEEVMFLAIQMMCSKFIGISAVDETLEQVKKYDNKLLEFVDMSLQVIGNILDVDLSQDKKLKESLIIHLRPTIFRIRHGLPQTNSLVHFIKSEYKTVFRATMSISIMFEEYYGLQLTEDEVGYIVLYIQSSLERIQQQFDVLLIADFSRGHAQLLIERLKRSIQEIKTINIMSAHDFKLYGDKKSDVIITQKKLDVKDPRIIMIPNLLSDSGIVSLREQISDVIKRRDEVTASFTPICYPLLDPDLMFVHQKFKNKEELLKFMSEAMAKRGYVTTGFYSTVMEREQATATSIGNQISITHGAQSEVIEPKLSITILDNPIAWNDEDKVDIVFLLGFKMTTPEEINRIQCFYREYISIIEEDANLKKIKAMDSNVDLYRFLIQ